jgi:hypothetical protein
MKKSRERANVRDSPRHPKSPSEKPDASTSIYYRWGTHLARISLFQPPKDKAMTQATKHLIEQIVDSVNELDSLIIEAVEEGGKIDLGVSYHASFDGGARDKETAAQEFATLAEQFDRIAKKLAE